MSILKKLIPKQSPEKKALNLEIEKARAEGYKKARLERARKEGYEKGRFTTTERIQRSLSGIGKASQDLMKFRPSGGLLDPFSFPEARRRVTRRKRKKR